MLQRQLTPSTPHPNRERGVMEDVGDKGRAPPGAVQLGNLAGEAANLGNLWEEQRGGRAQGWSQHTEQHSDHSG